MAVRALHRPAPPPPPRPAARVVWSFEPPARGAIISTPWVTDAHVYAAVIHDQGFSTYGTVYCLQRSTGKVVWQFDDDGAMQHMYSSPRLAEGRLYVGEGMHANRVCKVYCLDAATGRKLWDHATGGHIESSPCVADGRVYFGSGDDGLYCLDASTGQVLGHFREPWHVDTSPAVVDGLLYAGSAASRAQKTNVAFCLSVEDLTRPRWAVPTELPVCGSPVVDRGLAWFGLGNGWLDRSAPPPARPAGALLCVDAATGRRLWQYPVPDAVMAAAAVDGGAVYFGSRDGHCYCLDRAEGRLRWKRDCGSPVVASPRRAGPWVYVAASGGRMCRLRAEDGAVDWTFDVAAHAQSAPRLFAAPVVAGEGAGRQVFLGTELRTPTGSAAVLYCLQDD